MDLIRIPAIFYRQSNSSQKPSSHSSFLVTGLNPDWCSSHVAQPKSQVSNLSSGESTYIHEILKCSKWSPQKGLNLPLVLLVILVVCITMVHTPFFKVSNIFWTNLITRLQVIIWGLDDWDDVNDICTQALPNCSMSTLCQPLPSTFHLTPAGEPTS